MCEYFHELMLLNGHYPTGDINFGVFNIQVFSKTSQEGHGLVALNFFHGTLPFQTEERNGRCSRAVSFVG